MNFFSSPSLTTIKTNQNMSTEITPQEKGNKGEKNEIQCTKQIFENKDNYEYLTGIFGQEASSGIEIINPITNAPYTSVEQIKKAAARSKADLVIQFKQTERVRYISMKSMSGAKPSLLNHTPRSAKTFKTTLQPVLGGIDELAKEYNQKRTNKEIGEDVAFSKLQCFSDEHVKSCFVKMLSYFMFTGTGARLSQNECDSILIINTDNSITFIDCDTDEKKNMYVLSILHKCVISFRDKGMPKPDKIDDECLPWIYMNETNGKKCGSIHVRL